MEKYVYVIMFILFIPIVFEILRTLKIEKYFNQNATWQIKMAYIVFSFIGAELLTQSFQRLFSLVGAISF